MYTYKNHLVKQDYVYGVGNKMCLLAEWNDFRINPKSLERYKKLKEDGNGLSVREYNRRKTEFINEVLEKVKKVLWPNRLSIEMVLGKKFTTFDHILHKI